MKKATRIHSILGFAKTALSTACSITIWIILKCDIDDVIETFGLGYYSTQAKRNNPRKVGPDRLWRHIETWNFIFPFIYGYWLDPDQILEYNPWP